MTLLIILTFTLLNVFGQNPVDTAKSNVLIISGDRLNPFLDSLKNLLLTDTTKFNQTDLIFTATGRRNSKPYSPLFIINGAYIYKLDIVRGSDVLTFIKEILDYKKIESITYMDGSKASQHFGQNTWQGVVLITIFDKVEFNPRVAGLTLRKNKSGDNFTVRKKGEILIRD